MQRTQRYIWSDKIPDREIKEQFEMAEEVFFLPTRFNKAQYCYLGFTDLPCQFPLLRVLRLIDIAPQQLRPVFNHHRVLEKKVKRVKVKRSLPFTIFETIGVMPKQYKDKVVYQVNKIELPETIETYDQLGRFPLTDQAFRELAFVLDKPVTMQLRNGETGEYHALFTANPTGEIIEVAKT